MKITKAERDKHSKDVAQWQIAAKNLEVFRKIFFPLGSVVQVDCPQYKGTGIVEHDHTCPLDKLPVLLQNGNVWWYPIVSCEPTPEAAP